MPLRMLRLSWLSEATAASALALTWLSSPTQTARALTQREPWSNTPSQLLAVTCLLQLMQLMQQPKADACISCKPAMPLHGMLMVSTFPPHSHQHVSMPSCSDSSCACSINQHFCELLEAGPKPTVAAVQGMALGGGLEVAMACNVRIAAPGKALTDAYE